MVRVTAHALHGHSLDLRSIAVALLAFAHGRQQQVLAVMRLLRLVTGQASCIAGELALDLVATMIEAAGREVIAREADRVDLEAVEIAFAFRIHDDVAADAAAPRELIFDLRVRAAHRALERRAAAGLLFLVVSGQTPPLARRLAGVRIGELAREVVLQRQHDFTRFAVRQLPLGRAGIEGQLVTLGAAILHRDRLEVLAVRLETMTVRTIDRLVVAATQDAIRIEVLGVRELDVRLLDRLVQVCNLRLPFELEGRASRDDRRLEQARLELRMMPGAEAGHRLDVQLSELLRRILVALDAHRVAAVDEEARRLVVLAMTGRAPLRRAKLRQREMLGRDVVVNRLVAALARLVLHADERLLMARVAANARRLLMRRTERPAVPEIIARHPR